jgi:hypothetical protein
MFIVAFDPGETTGIAGLETVNQNLHGFQTRDIADVASALYRVRQWCEEGETVMVLAENFVGGGYRTTAAINTLKVLGFIEHFCTTSGVPVLIRAPQLRKAYVSKAKELVGDVHAADAVAHILSYLDEIKE